MLQNPSFQLFILGVTFMVGGYAEMTHPNPNPKSCSKCCKIPKSNFLFLGVMFMVGGYAEMPPPQPENSDF